MTMKTHGNYIGGQWTEGQDAAPNVNPSDTRDVVGLYARASRADAVAAIAAAHAAQPAWAALSPQQRADALDQAGSEIQAPRAELAELLAREEGKALPDALGEVVRAAQIFKFFAGEALRVGGELLPFTRQGMSVEITREPVGVVSIITPWNFPIAIPAWKIAPALAYGNAVVFKPAELVSGSAWALAELLSRCGLLAGTFNLVMGRGREIGYTLLEDPRVAAVTFTGSEATGRRVAQACVSRPRAMAKFQLEMGGKNPLVVLDDADLEVAVSCTINGAFYSTGQRCIASSRLIVTEGIHDRFVAAMVERMRGLAVGDARAGHRDRPRRRCKAAGTGPGLHPHRPRGRRTPGGRRRRDGPGRRQAGLLPAAGPVHRDHQRHAHQPRGDLRPGGHGDPRARCGRSAGRSQRCRPASRAAPGATPSSPAPTTSCAACQC